MLTEENLRDEVLHLLAITNNYLMDLEVKGDNILKSADIMQRCIMIYNFMKPVGVLDVQQEVHREVDAGSGESVGSDD